MNIKTYSVILIAFLSTCLTLFGQGRVDNDPILYKIWLNTLKVDRDTTIKYSLTSTLTQNGTQGILAFYKKQDTVYKIIIVEGNSLGTKLTTTYFVDMAPAFISVKRNNYAFSADKKLFSNTLTSFEDVVDISLTQDKPLYPLCYSACYYYRNRQLYYSNVTENEKSRVDNPSDKREALLSFAEAELLFEYH